MSATISLPELLAGENRLFAFQEGCGPLILRWGEAGAGADPTLRWRKFFPARPGEAPLWAEFPDSASWNLGQGAQLAAGGVPSCAPPPAPAIPPKEDKAAWLGLCAAAASLIHDGAARKIVPSRAATFRLSATEHRRILAALPGRLFGPALPATYRFLVKSGASVFFGASPELLFRREGGHLFVPAIAGTRPLAAGTPEPVLRTELLESAKERAEHAVVVEGILEALGRLGIRGTAPATPEVIRVPGLLHLFTPVQAADPTAISSEALVEALHPTPAISGYPKEASWSFLFQFEPEERGLFSSPLLFSLPGRDICVVAIRSGLLTGEQLRFFAGAGFVAGSDPEAEWEETGRKMQVLQNLLFGSAP